MNESTNQSAGAEAANQRISAARCSRWQLRRLIATAARRANLSLDDSRALERVAETADTVAIGTYLGGCPLAQARDSDGEPLWERPYHRFHRTRLNWFANYFDEAACANFGSRTRRLFIDD